MKTIETVMGNTSTNINKAEKDLSSQTIEHIKTATYDVRNSGHGLGQTHKCCGVKSDPTISTPTL